jgi:hypothetical protein
MIITGKVERVIDGDSVLVRTSASNVEDIRMKDVHSPEIGELGHDEAKEYLKRLLPIGTAVTVDIEVDATNNPVKTAGKSRTVTITKTGGAGAGAAADRLVGTIERDNDGVDVNASMRAAQNKGIIRKGGY